MVMIIYLFISNLLVVAFLFIFFHGIIKRLFSNFVNLCAKSTRQAGHPELPDIEHVELTVLM